MKNILLLIHDDAGQESRFQAALDMARGIKGHLTCLDVTIIPEYAGDYVGRAGVLFVEEQKREAANKARMTARLEREDVAFQWIDSTGFVAEAVEEHAGLIDLVILSGDPLGALLPHMADAIGDLLVGLGKPILVMPATARGFDVRGRAMVAWDGSDNAEAALRAAVPLLRHAAEVTLFHAEERSRAIEPEDAARYLSRHEIEPVIKRAAAEDGAGNAILAEVASGRHDYVVMGAFGRPRTLERIFGGTTHKMLHKSPVPVLLAHCR